MLNRHAVCNVSSDHWSREIGENFLTDWPSWVLKFDIGSWSSSRCMLCFREPLHWRKTTSWDIFKTYWKLLNTVQQNISLCGQQYLATLLNWKMVQIQQLFCHHFQVWRTGCRMWPPGHSLFMPLLGPTQPSMEAVRHNVFERCYVLGFCRHKASHLYCTVCFCLIQWQDENNRADELFCFGLSWR